MSTALTTFALSLALAGPTGAKKTTEITWLGHATFEIVSPKGTKLIVDPFLKGNPKTPAAKKDLSKLAPKAILVSHSHGDHSADAVALAKASGAMVIGAYDYIGTLEIPKKQQMGGNAGGKIVVDDVTVHLVPAVHGSQPGGRPLGFVIEVAGGPRIYHTGDTWIFGDMALIQEIHRPDVLLLQAGGGPYNQDPETAALAVKKYFRPKVIVPMHYGTFPPLAKETDVKMAFKGDERLKVMKPGETLKL